MMKKLNILAYLASISFLIILTFSCEPREPNEGNPFDNNVVNQDTVAFEFGEIDPNSIAGLYQNIFKPTCANSGCHDGTFEPDFRTIESSYHSLVYQVPVKNDGTLTFRVDPGNPDNSAIMNRLAGIIKPIMPIEVEPDSDWDINGDTYLENIKTWIENGALDLAGNESQEGFISPSLFGAVGFHQGELLNRKDGYGNIIVPNSANEIELYFAFDTINTPENFSVNEIEFGYDDGDEFQVSTKMNMTILNTPIQQYGLNGTLVDFTHKIDLNLNSPMLSDDSYYMRVKVKDGSYPTTEIPANNGLYFIKEYMSFRRTN